MDVAVARSADGAEPGFFAQHFATAFAVMDFAGIDRAAGECA